MKSLSEITRSINATTGATGEELEALAEAVREAVQTMAVPPATREWPRPQRPTYVVVHPDCPKLRLEVYSYPGVATVAEGTDSEGQPYRQTWRGHYTAIECLNNLRMFGCELSKGGAK